MMGSRIDVRRWPEEAEPKEEELRARLVDEGLHPYRWSNGPGYRYSAHSHGYDKVICVVKGSILFNLPQKDRSVSLEAGDRLYLTAGAVHDAIVGGDGVVCLEAHR
ncbi:MAG: hypothetical protein R3300_12930 [Candidatus Promineifilaceae bacterium]|nr:hypothetical protein [Candidatus Promineifilaceae bacterium]